MSISFFIIIFLLLFFLICTSLCLNFLIDFFLFFSKFSNINLCLFRFNNLLIHLFYFFFICYIFFIDLTILVYKLIQLLFFIFLNLQNWIKSRNNFFDIFRFKYFRTFFFLHLLFFNNFLFCFFHFLKQTTYRCKCHFGLILLTQIRHTFTSKIFWTFQIH